MHENLKEIRKVNLSEDYSKPDLQSVATNIFFDRLNNVWIGTMVGCRFSVPSPSPFTKFTQTDKGKPINHIYFLYPQASGLLACDENGLYKLSYKSNTIKICDSNLIYYLFFADSRGNTICSNQQGLFIWDDEHDKVSCPIEKIYPEFRPFKGRVFTNCVQLGDSAAVLSTNSADTYLWNQKSHAIQPFCKETVHDVPGDRSVYMLHPDDHQGLWILSGSRIQRFNMMTCSDTDITSFLPGMNYFFDIIQLRSKSFISSYGSGLIEIDSNFTTRKIYSTASGLSNNCVYRIIDENDSVLWTSTNNGLNRINTSSGKISTYFVEDGIHSNEFEQFSAAKIGHKPVFGGLKGFTIIDPSLVTANTRPPSVYFTIIKAQTKDGLHDLDTSGLGVKELPIDNSWLQATISFIGINYSNPNRVTYNYRVRERDTSWINLDGQGFINLIGLSPGKYTIEVRAANEDGYWSEGKQISLIFQPKWYQTWLFKILVVLVAAGMLYALYHYRISQIKKQQQIRRDIASDLHDDIGSTLNSIHIFTHLAETTPDKGTYLQEIKTSLKQATAGLRDMIWVLDDKEDTLQELLDRLQQFVVPVSRASGIHVDFLMEGVLTKMVLGKTEKRNLLLTIKEAVNNSIKYAGCKNIRVNFMKRERKIIVEIKDDGCGFSLNEVTFGNGIINMKERMSQINYTINIQSAVGAGTSIVISS